MYVMKIKICVIKPNLYVIQTKFICYEENLYVVETKSSVLGVSAPAGACSLPKRDILIF